MSAGAFDDTIYEANNGAFYSARVQPETLALTVDGTANAGGAGPIPAGSPSANMRGSKSQNGVTARTVSLRLPNGGTPPDGYTGDNLVVPILTPAVFDAISRSSTVVYLGATWRVAGTSNEVVR